MKKVTRCVPKCAQVPQQVDRRWLWETGSLCVRSLCAVAFERLLQRFLKSELLHSQRPHPQQSHRNKELHGTHHVGKRRAKKPTQLGWRPSLLGWRPSQLGRKPLLFVVAIGVKAIWLSLPDSDSSCLVTDSLLAVAAYQTTTPDASMLHPLCIQSLWAFLVGKIRSFPRAHLDSHLLTHPFLETS